MSTTIVNTDYLNETSDADRAIRIHAAEDGTVALAIDVAGSGTISIRLQSAEALRLAEKLFAAGKQASGELQGDDGPSH